MPKRISSLNKVELIGIVGSTRVKTVGEQTIVKISVATEYAYKVDGLPCIDTTWLYVTAINDAEKNLSEIKKGNVVNVVGRIRVIRVTDSYGNDRYEYEIVARKVKILNKNEEPIIPEKEPTQDK